jgi:hypothetical protein
MVSFQSLDPESKFFYFTVLQVEVQLPRPGGVITRGLIPCLFVPQTNSFSNGMFLVNIKKVDDIKQVMKYVDNYNSFWAFIPT